MKFVIASPSFVRINSAKEPHRGIIFLFLFLSFLFFSGKSFAQTGPNNPSTAVNNNSYGTVGWTGLTDVFTSNDLRSVCTGLANGASTNYLVATNFGFSLNACDNITGIEVRVEWSKTGGQTMIDDVVALVIGGNIIVASDKATGSVTIPVTPDIISLYGNSTDTWGQTLVGADVNQNNFGVAIAVKRTSGGSPTDVLIDNVTIKLFHSTPPAMTYSSSSVTQISNVVNPGTINNPVIRVDVVMNTGCPPVDATSFTVNMNGTTSLADIQNAKLFFTGTNPVFNSSSQLGSTVGVIPGGNFTINGFSQKLFSGTNYFWLSADVVAGATLGNVVDAECPSLIVDGISKTPTVTAPAGNRVITAPVVYTVGASKTYTTIQAAYNAVPASPANSYIIEVYSDYNSAVETFPITFGSKSNIYNIIVRPAAGNSNIICQGTIGSDGLWKMSGALNIVIDGRPGGVGATKDFIVRNNKGAAPFGTAFLITNDSKDISFYNLIIESETTTGVSLDGIATIGTTTGSSGNDNISFSNCVFRDVTGGGGSAGSVPWSGVYSNGTAAKNNDNITVDNCEFAQGGFNTINMFANTGNCTITNNQIYFPTGVSGLGANNLKFININSGANHIVSGNFIGGSSANCGGTQLAVSGTTATVMGISVSAVGNNVIENNTISNIKYTVTTGAGAPLTGIFVSGSGNFTIGSSGKGNTIGNMGVNNSFILQHDGTTGVGIEAIASVSAGSVTVSYNNLGGITVQGSHAASNTSMIKNTSGTMTCSNNTIGGTPASSILISSNAQSYVVSNSSASGLTFTNNTLQNIAHNATTASFGGVYNSAGPLTCTGNTFQNISSASDCSVNTTMFIIDHQPSAAATADVSNNLIQNISWTYSGAVVTAKFFGISINQATSAATCNNNIIGGAGSNNMAMSPNVTSYGIYHSNTGTLSCDNNTIQQFNLTNAGATAEFSGVYNSSTAGITITNSTIKNITQTSASAPFHVINNTSGPLTCNTNTITVIASSSNNTFRAIEHAGGTATINTNTINNISLSNVASTARIIDITQPGATIADVTVDGNIIGTSNPSGILLHGNTAQWIIAKGAFTGAGNFNVTNNTVQGITLDNGGAATELEGLLGAVGVFTCSTNVIKNIFINSGYITANQDQAAIWCTTASTGNLISKNVIQNIQHTNTGAVATWNEGMYLANGSGTVSKNSISQLTNSSTSASAKIVGIYSSLISWNFYNNVILLDNNGSTSPLIIYGINATDNANTTNIYHNTIKIFGSQTGNAISACLFRPGNAAATCNVKNNLFQNIRTGGTSGHYTEYFNPVAGTYTTNYNYLEASDVNKLCNYGGVDKTLAAWKTSTAANNSISGTTVLGTQGDPPAGFAGASAGTNLLATVPDDKIDVARSVTPWMGAYEGTLVANSITTDPISPLILIRCTNFVVTYSITGTFNPANVFTAELSSPTGSWASPTNIGSVTATTNTPITAILPPATAAGTQYRIRVVSSDPVVIGSDNGADLVLTDGGMGNWVWQGTNTDNWFDPCNWDVKSLPDINSDVLIPGGTPFQPTITGTAANCNTITINATAGAVVNLISSAGGTLNIAQ